MSILGALLPPSNKGSTPVPLVSRSASGFWGNAWSRPAGVEAQLSAMEISGVVFGIVDKLAPGVAEVDWHLWKKAKSGKKEDRTEVTEHAAVDILNKPNPFYTRQKFFEACQQHYELTGESWMAVGRKPISTLPLELWPVSPMRMDPVPSAEKFLAGYVYTSPDGERVPLETSDVMFMSRPDPRNPYRGLGPIKPSMLDIESTNAAAQWNRNFFLNSAEPGGIIEVPVNLDDTQFNEMRMRWNEQHKGVANAHRVAILEHGKWVNKGSPSMRDMQFTELRGVTAAAIREAFGFPKFMTGEVADVNRASADASEAMFARWLIKPRLERWKQLLNFDFLPLFGTSASGLEFDYDDPVPANSEAENASRDSRTSAAISFIGAGLDRKKTLEIFDFPDIPFEPVEEPVLPPGEDPALYASLGAKGSAGALVRRPSASAGTTKPRSEWDELTAGLLNAAPPPEPELTIVQADWQAALDQLVAAWQLQVTPQQQAEIEQQVEEAVGDGDLSALAAMAVGTTAGAALILAALTALAAVSAKRIAAELVAQGAPPPAPATPTAASLSALAAATAASLGTSLAAAAGAEALRLAAPGVSGVDVADGVGEYIGGLSDRALRDQLAGALTRAQNESRLLTVRDVPQCVYVASEILDSATCFQKPGDLIIRCREIHGHVYDTWIDAWNDYAGGTYKHCKGRWRCRGTVVARWNPEAG